VTHCTSPEEKEGRDGGQEEYLQPPRGRFTSRGSSSPSCGRFGEEEKGKAQQDLEGREGARRNENATTNFLPNRQTEQPSFYQNRHATF
jgi:hypothetical protein